MYRKTGLNIIIPVALKYYCISYYFLNDYFTIHGDNININKSGTIAQGNSKLFRRSAVYGNELINLEVNFCYGFV